MSNRQASPSDPRTTKPGRLLLSLFLCAGTLSVSPLVSSAYAQDEGTSTAGEDSAEDSNEGDVCRDEQTDGENDDGGGKSCDGGGCGEGGAGEMDSNAASGDDQESAENGIGEENNPVNYDTGEKWSMVSDLTVRVTGQDFRLTRAYSSSTSENTYSGVVREVFTGIAPQQFADTGGVFDAGAGWGVSNLRAIFRRDNYVAGDPVTDGEGTILYYEIEYSSTDWKLLRARRSPRGADGIDASQNTTGMNGPGNQGLVTHQRFVSAQPVNTSNAANVPREGHVALVEPGKWAQVFETENSFGWIQRDLDVAGNKRVYDYGTIANSVVVYLNGEDETDSEAWVVLKFVDAPYISGGFSSWEERRRLMYAQAYRQDGSTTAGDPTTGAPIGRVDYYYLAEEDPDTPTGSLVVEYWDPTANSGAGGIVNVQDGMSDLLLSSSANDLGSADDLVMVARHVPLDDGQTHTTVTQYRYHDGSAAPVSGDERLQIEGQPHQMKMELRPQQIEYAARIINHAGSPTSATVLDTALDLLALDDDDVIGTGLLTGFSGTEVVDLAAKIVSYENSGDSRVTTQFLQAVDCGCGGGSGVVSATRLDYEYLEWNDGTYDGRSLYISEMAIGDMSPYRTYVRDQISPGGTGREDVWYVTTKGVLEGDGTSGGRWLTHREYMTPSFGLERFYSQAAVTAYTKAQPASPPGTPDPVAPAITLDGDAGWYRQYEYDDEYVSTSTIVTKSGMAIDEEDTIDTSYRTSANGRSDLPANHSRLKVANTTNADEIERRVFLYAFYETPTDPFGDGGTDSAYETYTRNALGGDKKETGSVKIRQIRTEQSPESENGKGGSWYESFEVYDAAGRMTYYIDEDGSITEYKYEDDTGAVTEIVRNRSDTGVPGGFVAPSTVGGTDTSVFAFHSSPNRSGGSLTTSITRDDLGRVTMTERPGGIESYIHRDLAEHPTQPGVLYLTHVYFPHEIDTNEYDGPVSVMWMDADGEVLRSSEHIVGTFSPYDPSDESDAATWLANLSSKHELSRSETEFELSGTMSKRRSWWRLDFSQGSPPSGMAADENLGSSDEAYYEHEYVYDAYGRLEAIVDHEGTRTERAYDVLDRVTEVSVGPDGGTLVDVAEYVYDSANPFATTPSSGSGNGNLSAVILHVDASTTRIYRYVYDLRDRLIVQERPGEPWMLTAYDNLDRPLRRGLFESGTDWGARPTSVTTAVAASEAFDDVGDYTSDRGRYEEWFYDQRGMVYRRNIAVDPTNGSSDLLSWNSWYDADGHELGSWGPNGPGVVTEFDGLDRVTTRYVTDRAGDGVVGSGGSYADATTVTGDHVIEQMEYSYASDGVLELVTTHRRLHTDTSTGPLTDTGTGSAGDGAVSTHTGVIYDDANRVKGIVEFGTGYDGFREKVSGDGDAVPSGYDIWDLDDLTDTYTDTLFEWREYDERGLLRDRITARDDSGDVTAVRVLYDALGRTGAVIERGHQDPGSATVVHVTWDGTDDRWSVSWPNIGGTPDSDLDRVTSFVYDSVGATITRVAHLPASGGTDTVQVTAYDYGTTTAQGSLIESDRLLAAVRYPNESTGEPGTTAEYTVSYAYNRLGELIEVEDQRGTVRDLARDLAGRLDSDTVSTVGSGVDDHVRLIDVGYDTLGRLASVTSYEGTTTGATVHNDVRFGYTGLWQIESVWQNPDGVASTSGTDGLVSYTYDNEPVSGSDSTGNHSRLVGIKYPLEQGASHDTVVYEYPSGISDRISRVSGIDVEDLDPTLADTMAGADPIDLLDYEYLGMGIVISAEMPSVTGDLTMDRYREADGTSTAGQYPAFDRFGRVIRQRWLTDKPSSSTIPVFDREHGYDRVSNRLHEVDQRTGVFVPDRDRIYTYDRLDRLATADYGVVNGTYSGMTSSDVLREYDLDILGNWVDFDTTEGGTTINDSRTHNDANELTLSTRSVVGGGFTINPVSYTNDKAGNRTRRTEDLPVTLNNMSGDDRLEVYIYDAWNRLVEVQHEEPGDMPDTIAEYEYNGLFWRVKRRLDSSRAAYDGIDQERRIYFTASWQQIEEHVDDDTSTAFEASWVNHNFYGIRYIDDIAARRRIWDTDDDGELREFSDAATPDDIAEAFFYVTDALFSVRNILTLDGNQWTRLDYDVYGDATNRYPGDIDGDGSFTTTGAGNDLSLYTAVATGGYEADWDFNYDGADNTTDTNTHVLGAASRPLIPRGWVGDPSLASGPDNVFGLASYRHDAESGLHEVRFRHYDAATGRWMQRDPIGYQGGPLLYQMVSGNPNRYTDPLGLQDSATMSAALSPAALVDIMIANALSNGATIGAVGTMLAAAGYTGEQLANLGVAGDIIGAVEQQWKKWGKAWEDGAAKVKEHLAAIALASGPAAACDAARNLKINMCKDKTKQGGDDNSPKGCSRADGNSGANCNDTRKKALHMSLCAGIRQAEMKYCSKANMWSSQEAKDGHQLATDNWVDAAANCWKEYARCRANQCGANI